MSTLKTPAELRAMLEKATKGEWIAVQAGERMTGGYSQPWAVAQWNSSLSRATALVAGCFGDTAGGLRAAESNAELIAAAVNSLPDLLAVVEAAMKLCDARENFLEAPHGSLVEEDAESEVHRWTVLLETDVAAYRAKLKSGEAKA